MQTLNSPLEVGLRGLVVLAESFPAALDIDRLVLLDYCLVHSGDFGGPASIQEAISTRGSELSIKRSILEHGIQLMSRGGMVDVQVSGTGIVYRASESAVPFLKLVDSPILRRLQDIAVWVTSEFADLPNEEIRELIRRITTQWAEDSTDDLQGEIVSEISTWSEEESNL